MGKLSSDDIKFIEQFEKCELQKGCWSHEAHVRMAWIQFNRSDSFEEGLTRIRQGIQRFNASLGIVTGYHETVTVAFGRLIHFRILHHCSDHTWEKFLAENQDLLSRSSPILERFYSREVLKKNESRISFLKPDRFPLPEVGILRMACPEDASGILAIYARYVAETAVTFEYEVPAESEFVERIKGIQSFASWIVYEVEGEIAGYAYASRHRSRAAYQWAAEVSVYVHTEFKKRGIGRLLYTRLLQELTYRGFCVALAGIALPNEASVSFHESFGFESVGIFHNIGFKLGSWHDVGWWQLRLRPLGEVPSIPFSD